MSKSWQIFLAWKTTLADHSVTQPTDRVDGGRDSGSCFRHSPRNHFVSHQLAEAAGSSFSQAAANLAGVVAVAFVNEYLSRKHREALGNGCTLAALSGDAARQPELIKQAFATGIENELAGLAREDGDQGEARAKRIDTLAHVVGALVLSRACPDDSPLADEILEVCRTRILSQFDRKGEGPDRANRE